jgi:hypothetical protein
MAVVEALTDAYDRALPMEYRYRTDMSGSAVAGLAVLLGLLLFGRGPVAIGLGVPAVLAIAYGAFGLIADIRSLVRTAGKRVIITDDLLQEVDENGRIRWTIRPTEIDIVRPQKGPLVFPWSGPDGWRAETWTILLKDDRSITVPVWLLPDRGMRFRQRFENFVAFARRARPRRRPA